jgi:hypothetical protein
VREAVCQILEKKGKAAHFSDENKQKYSEVFKCLTELVREQDKRLRQANNRGAEQQSIRARFRPSSVPAMGASAETRIR